MGIFNNEIKTLDIITRKQILETITVFHDQHHHAYTLSSIENAVLTTDIYKTHVAIEYKIIYPKISDFDLTTAIQEQINVYENTNNTSIPIQSFKLYYAHDTPINDTTVVLERKIGGKINFIRTIKKYLLTIGLYINLRKQEYRTYVIIIKYAKADGETYYIKKSINAINGFNIYSFEFDGESPKNVGSNCKSVTLMFHNAISLSTSPMATFSTIIFSILFLCMNEINE